MLKDINHLAIKESQFNLMYTLHLKDLETLKMSPANFPGLRRTRTEFEARGVIVQAVRGLGF